MERAITFIGNLAALVGILLCLVSGVSRAAGFYQFAGYAAITLFQAGIGLMVLACLCKLESLLLRMR
jgi:hypothetical protein